jgi:hypothetical protein
MITLPEHLSSPQFLVRFVLFDLRILIATLVSAILLYPHFDWKFIPWFADDGSLHYMINNRFGHSEVEAHIGPGNMGLDMEMIL